MKSLVNRGILNFRAKTTLRHYMSINNLGN